MRKFVAECCDTVGCICRLGRRRRCYLVGTRIAVEAFAVEFIILVVEFESMRPHGIGVVVVGLAVACVYYEYIIDIAVVIEVVLRIIDFVVECLNSLKNHFACAGIIVSAVVRHPVLERYWAVDFKGGIVQALRLLQEIIASRTSCPVLVETGFVELAGKIFFRVGKTELDIGKFYQKHKSLALACTGKRR